MTCYLRYPRFSTTFAETRRRIAAFPRPQDVASFIANLSEAEINPRSKIRRFGTEVVSSASHSTYAPRSKPMLGGHSPRWKMCASSSLATRRSAVWTQSAMSNTCTRLSETFAVCSALCSIQVPKSLFPAGAWQRWHKNGIRADAILSKQKSPGPEFRIDYRWSN